MLRKLISVTLQSPKLISLLVEIDGIKSADLSPINAKQKINQLMHIIRARSVLIYAERATLNSKVFDKLSELIRQINKLFPREMANLYSDPELRLLLNSIGYH